LLHFYSLSAQETIDALSGQLDQTYCAVAANLLANPAARVETLNGKEDVTLYSNPGITLVCYQSVSGI
jgi:hypothetical protein